MTKSLKYGFSDNLDLRRNLHGSSVSFGAMSWSARLYNNFFRQNTCQRPWLSIYFVQIVNGGLRWQLLNGPRRHCTSIRRSWNQVPSRDRLSSKPTTCNFATDTKHHVETKWQHSPLCSSCFMRSYAVRPSFCLRQVQGCQDVK